MNDKEQIEQALSTGEADKGGGDAELQAKLEKAQHTAEMWAGRAKTQGEELKKLREEVEQLKAGKSAAETVAAIPAEVKGDTPDDYLKPALAGAKMMVDGAMKELREENERLKEEQERIEARNFADKLQSLHRKFFEEVTPGKDKEAAWKEFKELNKETYGSVMSGRDATRFSKFVDSFYRYIGVQNPDKAGNGAAAPSPTTTGGAQPGGDNASKATMTTAEFVSERHRAEELRRAGRMDEWRELDARLRDALNSGRVK